MKTEDILAERGKIYGIFANNAQAAQNLKNSIEASCTTVLEPDMREALDQICSKISRIITGSATHIDNWDDIAGYAKLVADRLRTNEIKERHAGSTGPSPPTPSMFPYRYNEPTPEEMRQRRKEATDPAKSGGANGMKYGDVIITPDGRRARAGEFMPDGDVDVTYADGTHDQVKWSRCRLANE